MTLWAAAFLVAAQLVAQSAGQRAPVPAQPAPSTWSAEASLTLAFDALPRRDVVEGRPEINGRVTWSAGDRWRATADATLAMLAGRRDGFAREIDVRVNEAWIEATGGQADLRVGFGRISWGKLDEIQPSDVINPLDSSRFFLGGRAEARLPVGFVRGRLFVSEALTLEGVVAPWFRRGLFDQLDEDSSPFNVVRDVVLPAGVLPTGLNPANPAIAAQLASGVQHQTPDFAWRNVSAGGRMLATTGRVDWAVQAYRGFDGFGPITFETAFESAGPSPAVVGRLVGRHPRFTMVAADVEAVFGRWAWRAEGAGFVEKTLAARSFPGVVSGHVIEAGAGVDRDAGAYRLFASLLVHREWSAADAAVEQTDVSLVGSIERAFRRERHRARAFAVVNPADRSAFMRAYWTWTLRDDVSMQVSAGAFAGAGDDAVARFSGRDFVMLAFRIHP